MSIAEYSTLPGGDTSDRWTRQATIEPPGRRLTGTQHEVLRALGTLCPDPGQEASLQQIVDATALKGGAAIQALQGLERRQCAIGHEAGQWWSLSWNGRDRVRALDAALTV